MLKSATRGETLTPNPNECSSTITSGTNNIYPYPYIDINDRGHRFRSMSPLTNYPHALTTLLFNFFSIWRDVNDKNVAFSVSRYLQVYN